MATLRKTKANTRAVPSWLTIGTPSGTNDGESIIQVKAYTGREDRTATITAETSGGATDTATINQSGKPAHITIATKTYSVGATDGSVEITGTSNVASLALVGSTRISGAIYKLTVNEVVDESWNGSADTQVDGDPGAYADYSFKLSITYPANNTESAKKDMFAVKTAEGNITSGDITINQAAGTKTYSDITITAFTYPTIAAKGGTVTPTLSYSQTWGWNGSTTGGGIITSGAALSFSGDVVTSSGSVSASTKGTTVSGVTTVDEVTITVKLNDKTKTSSFAVKQAANAVTSYGNVVISGGTVADIPAAGGSISSASGISASQTITYTSEATRAGEVDITYNKAISAETLGTTVKSRTLIGQLVATATGEGSKNATKEFDVYQAANAVTTYGEVSLPLTTPVSLQTQGQTYDLGAQVDAKFAQTITFTSGATRKGVISLEEYVVKTLKEGFSLNDDTGEVTVTQNTGTSARNGFVVTVSVTGEGSKSASTDVTFNQQGSSSYITVTPETLEFEAAGGTKTITIESNDSWTIS